MDYTQAEFLNAISNGTYTNIPVGAIIHLNNERCSTYKVIGANPVNYGLDIMSATQVGCMYNDGYSDIYSYQNCRVIRWLNNDFMYMFEPAVRNCMQYMPIWYTGDIKSLDDSLIAVKDNTGNYVIEGRIKHPSLVEFGYPQNGVIYSTTYYDYGYRYAAFTNKPYNPDAYPSNDTYVPAGTYGDTSSGQQAMWLRTIVEVNDVMCHNIFTAYSGTTGLYSYMNPSTYQLGVAAILHF